ncbi:unnamed protein product [Oikopleura dioica]|uniref:Uncharacterized protein n=1 Tax=Oikopleura dioica TaxID=34765 RepID=E4Y7D8_OIKDI|nr:unnamed protein product [Oikopleura dioica]
MKTVFNLEKDLLRGTIDSLSQSGRSLESTPPPINSDFYSESVYSKQILNKMKEMNFQLQNLSRSVEDVRREKNSSFRSLEISMVGNLAKLSGNTFCCGHSSDIQPFRREPSIREMIDKYHEYPSHFKKEITYEKAGKEKELRSVGVQAKIKKKKFSSFTEYMKNF